MSKALFAIFFISSLFSIAPYALAQPTGLLPTILPPCRPELPPNQGGCGVPEFLLLLKNVINWLFIIVTPLSVILISYGGILILISGGNQSLFQKGKDVIRAAVWGIVIAFSAWAIMYTLYTLVLQIDQPYRPFT